MLKRNLIPLFFASVLLLSTTSCLHEKKVKEYEAAEQATIDQYLKDNPTLDFEKKESGLYIHMLQPGTGAVPAAHDTVYVMYTAKFLNGYILDSNIASKDTLIFPISENLMLQGFEEGIMYLNKGAKATLLLPSKLAYGSYGYSIIPGYTPLLYDVELAKIVQHPAVK
jgi:FKBP-type peptidyl-prolyl cis-trans isomerase